MALYLGVFLLTLSGLMFEIGLTRIFSATIWYHFAFVAISVALLGWGLGGFALHLLSRGFSFTDERAATLTLLYAASLPLALCLIVRFPFIPDRLVFYFVVSLAPLPPRRDGARRCLRPAPRRRPKPLLRGPPGSLGGRAPRDLPPVVAGRRDRRPRRSPRPCRGRRLLLQAPGLAARRPRPRGAVSPWRSTSGPASSGSAARPPRACYQHLAAQPGARIALTGWNAYSRIDAVTGFPVTVPGAPLHRLRRVDERPRAGTGTRERRPCPELVSRAALQAGAGAAETLVIGPGGGSDVLVALAAGSARPSPPWS